MLTFDDPILHTPKTINIDRLEYHLLSLELNLNVKFAVRLFESNTFYRSCIVTIEGALYDQWGTNDSFIEDVLLRNVSRMLESNTITAI